MLSSLIIIGTIASVLAAYIGWKIKERHFLKDDGNIHRNIATIR